MFMHYSQNKQKQPFSGVIFAGITKIIIANYV